jgi:hypothetical protein
MAVQTFEKEVERIEQLGSEVESLLEKVDARKDLKEKRGVLKQTLYDGSNKLKHVVPKGKRI